MDHTENSMMPGRSQEERLEAIERDLAKMREAVEDTHKMVKGLSRWMRLGSVFSVVKWVIIIGVTLGAFYYVQPVFEAVLKTYASVGGIGSGPNGESVFQMFKSI